MNKIKSLDDLRKMKQSMEGAMSIREKSDVSEKMALIRVAMDSCGVAAGAREVLNAMFEKIERENVPAIVVQDGCPGNCADEPVVEVTLPGKEPVAFGNVDPGMAGEIIDKYVLRGEKVGKVVTVKRQKC